MEWRSSMMTSCHHLRRHRRTDGVEVIYDDVTPPLTWTMARACCAELTKQNSLRHTVVGRPANMPKPTQSILSDDVRDITVNAEGSGWLAGWLCLFEFARRAD